MDPLTAIGLVANIVQLIDTVVKVVGYINDVKDAPKDRARLARETTSLLSFLTDFRYKVEESLTDDPWFSSLLLLAEPGGPLEQLKEEMNELDRKLVPQTGLRRFRKSLVWTLDKREISNVISRIERLKALLIISRQEDHFNLSLEIKSNLDQLKNIVSNDQLGQERRDVITWISDLDFSTKQQEFLARGVEGTGEWFLCNDAFTGWLARDSGTLWCSGLPGAGKTIIASLVISHLEQEFAQKNVAVAYIFCNYKEQASQTAVNLVASLLQQLVQSHAVLPEEFTNFVHRHLQKRTRPTMAEWSNLLQLQIRRFNQVFIIIDALDEYSEEGGTRDLFLNEIRKLQLFVHVLITSRPITGFESEIEGATHLEIRATDGDVKRYLENRIVKEGRLRRLLRADLPLQETIITKIVENAKGMFLLAQLQMDSVAKKNSRRDIRRALENLPNELSNMYDDAMRRIWSQGEEDVKLAERVLSWIVYALRPLLLTEIQHALAVEIGDSCFDEGGIPEEDFLVFVCAGLVTVDPESRVIRLVHYTTQEYFENGNMPRFPNARVLITTICLTYLSFEDFHDGYWNTSSAIDDRLSKYHLLEYASQHWGHHARGDVEEHVKELALKFLRNEPNLTNSVYAAEHRKQQFPMEPDLPTAITGLHVTAYFGLAVLVRHLLDLGNIEANSRDSLGRTPLFLAAENGHAEAISQMLQHSVANPNVKDFEDVAPLTAAAANGHERAVEYLLHRSDVNINIADRYFGQTPLWRAADKGHGGVVKLLLQRPDINANKKDKIYGRTPLWQAADQGHEEVVRLLLLRSDIDIKATDLYNCQTPLAQALDRGHPAVVQLLLEREGVHTDSRGNEEG